MNDQYTMPADDLVLVPADLWQDDETEPYLLAAAVEAEANYSYEEQTS